MDQREEHKPERYPSPLFQWLLKLKVWLVERFRVGERQLMLLWAALVGLLGALAAEFFRSAVGLAKARGADVGRTLGWCDPLDWQSSDHPYPAENDYRLYGSDRRWKWQYLGSSEPGKEDFSPFLHQYRGINRARRTIGPNLFAGCFVDRSASGFSDRSTTSLGRMRGGRWNCQCL